jgi:predicted PurR-regulated permease PerM
MESHTFPLPADVRWRRLFGVGLFLGLLYLFRHLAPVFICFVVLERGLGFLADELDRRTSLQRKGAIAVVLSVLALAIGGVLLWGVNRLVAFVRPVPVLHHVFREDDAVAGSRLTAAVEALFKSESVDKLRRLAGLEGEKLTEVLKQHTDTALHYATSTAHVMLFILIGALLAIIYLFERQELDEWRAQIPSRSVQGTLLRWFGYVGDSIAITVKMQAIVAVVSAVLTLPLLIVLELPHVPLLFLFILVTGLVPVVGNVISGVVLCYVAYTARGAWAVAVFLAVTFVLHKIESYYLNPRLTREHVKLPGIVLIVALLLFEQAIGFVGLFLSFPALYVASRIADEWREERKTLEREVAVVSVRTPPPVEVAPEPEPEPEPEPAAPAEPEPEPEPEPAPRSARKPEPKEPVAG